MSENMTPCVPSSQLLNAAVTGVGEDHQPVELLVPGHLLPPVAGVGGQEELVISCGDHQLWHQHSISALKGVNNVEYLLHLRLIPFRCDVEFPVIREDECPPPIRLPVMFDILDEVELVHHQRDDPDHPGLHRGRGPGRPTSLALTSNNEL